MHVGSTEFLKLIDSNDAYILLEKGTPLGRLKREFISLMAQDGRGLEPRSASGYRASPLQLRREIFDDVVAASFIEQDGPEDAEGRSIFRLTLDGYAAARS